MTDFTMFSGNTHTIRVTVTDEESGLPVDLTSATEIKFKVSKKAGDDVPLFQKLKTLSEVTVTDAAAGKFETTLLPADTVDKKGDYYCESDIFRPTLAGGLTTVTTGKMTVTQTLIRAADLAP